MFIVWIIILLLKLSGIASPLTILINNKDASVYTLALKSLINLVIWGLALVLNSILFYLSVRRDILTLS